MTMLSCMDVGGTGRSGANGGPGNLLAAESFVTDPKPFLSSPMKDDMDRGMFDASFSRAKFKQALSCSFCVGVPRMASMKCRSALDWLPGTFACRCTAANELDRTPVRTIKAWQLREA